MANTTIKDFLLKTLKSLAFPVLLFVAFALLSQGRIVNQRTILAILRQSVVPTLICWALMFNMTLGAMNFSVGANVLFSTIVGGNLALLTNTGLAGFIVFAILLATLLSGIAGALYNLLRLPTIVLTLGLVMVYESAPRLFFEAGVTIPFEMTFLATSPWCFIVLGVMFLAFYLIYNKTAFGHNLRAIGKNPAIAVSVGLDSDKVKFTSFVLGGLFIGVAAVLYGSNQGQVENVSALGSMVIMMDSLMGVYFALFLSKFCNMAVAIVLSNVTIKIIFNGFVALGMSATIRDITTGVILFVLLVTSANQGVLAKKKADKKYAEEATARYRRKDGLPQS